MGKVLHCVSLTLTLFVLSNLDNGVESAAVEPVKSHIEGSNAITDESDKERLRILRNVLETSGGANKRRHLRKRQDGWWFGCTGCDMSDKWQTMTAPPDNMVCLPDSFDDDEGVILPD